MKKTSTKSLDSANQRYLEKPRNGSCVGDIVNLKQNPSAFQFNERACGSSCISGAGCGERSIELSERSQVFHPKDRFSDTSYDISEHSWESANVLHENSKHGISRYSGDEPFVMCEELREASYIQPHKPSGRIHSINERSEDRSFTLSSNQVPKHSNHRASQSQIFCDQNENVISSPNQHRKTCVHYNILVNQTLSRCSCASKQHCQGWNLGPMLCSERYDV